MSVGLKRRLLATGGGQAISQGLQAANQFILPPLFLAVWGANRYGIWLMLSALPSFLTWSDFGLGAASTNEMAMLAARGDWPGVRRIFQSNLLFQSIVAALCLAVAGGAIVLFGRTWKPMRMPSLKMVVWLLSAYVALNMLGNVWAAGFRAIQRYSRWLQWQNGAKFTELLAVLVILTLRRSEIPLAVALVGNRLVWLLITVVDFSRTQRDLPLGCSHASFSALKRLIKPAVGHFCFPIGQALSLQASTLLVGSILGATAVAVFGTTRTYARLLLQPVSIVNVAMWPEFSYALGASDYSLAKRLYGRVRQLSYSIALIGGLVSFLVGPAFITVWTHDRLQVHYNLVGALLLAVIINLFWNPANVVLIAVNDVFGMAWRYLLFMAVSLALMVPLLRMFGLWQGAAAISIGELAMLLYVPKEVERILAGKA